MDGTFAYKWKVVLESLKSLLGEEGVVETSHHLLLVAL